MTHSILEAIKQGLWDFEPQDVQTDRFSATGAMPGTRAKLSVMAQRIEQGLPLWHPCDRHDCEQEGGSFSAS